MGVLDKFINSMKFTDMDDEYDGDSDYLDEEDEVVEEPKPKVAKTVKPAREEEKTYEIPARKPAPISNVTPMRQKPVHGSKMGNGMEVCGIRPQTMEDAREIADTLLSNRTVLLNLEGLDVSIAQRIVDFTAGACFAINGNLQKVSHYIFIVTPANVDVSGDFQNLFNTGSALEVPIDEEY